jgi:general secretion pathway protein C
MSFIFGKESEQQPIVDSGTKAQKVEIELAKKPPLLTDYKAILERDLFRSVQADEINKVLQKDNRITSSERVAEKQLQLRLLGTVAGNEDVARAVIEDPKTKVQDLYLTGDFIQGARIEKIERDRIILFNDDRREILTLHVASRDPVSGENDVKTTIAEEPSDSEIIKVVSPTEREICKKAFLSKTGKMNAVLRTVKASPYIVNDEAKGLRITGLEALSVASYVGLGNGDIIQGINGQTITNKRKAFQVLRRARVLPSSDIEFLRGSERKMLSFKMR